eukprot:TRINITY_DN42144_c0_g1_i1.p1 TRINITY_DN42144_c0_g1~~TRINITY_DN42144_c0_g1_i1.p1  ORF type:complete len:657 (-),score=88.32 TRINITY_DN42144_c0_g1_i1:29-1999(-)
MPNKCEDSGGGRRHVDDQGSDDSESDDECVITGEFWSRRSRRAPETELRPERLLGLAVGATKPYRYRLRPRALVSALVLPQQPTSDQELSSNDEQETRRPRHENTEYMQGSNLHRSMHHSPVGMKHPKLGRLRYRHSLNIHEEMQGPELRQSKPGVEEDTQAAERRRCRLEPADSTQSSKVRRLWHEPTGDELGAELPRSRHLSHWHESEHRQCKREPSDDTQSPDFRWSRYELAGDRGDWEFDGHNSERRQRMFKLSGNAQSSDVRWSRREHAGDVRNPFFDRHASERRRCRRELRELAGDREDHEFDRHDSERRQRSWSRHELAGDRWDREFDRHHSERRRYTHNLSIDAQSSDFRWARHEPGEDSEDCELDGHSSREGSLREFSDCRRSHIDLAGDAYLRNTGHEFAGLELRPARTAAEIDDEDSEASDRTPLARKCGRRTDAPAKRRHNFSGATTTTPHGELLLRRPTKTVAKRRAQMQVRAAAARAAFAGQRPFRVSARLPSASPLRRKPAAKKPGSDNLRAAAATAALASIEAVPRKTLRSAGVAVASQKQPPLSKAKTCMTQIKVEKEEALELPLGSRPEKHAKLETKHKELKDNLMQTDFARRQARGPPSEATITAAMSPADLLARWMAQDIPTMPRRLRQSTSVYEV